MTRHLSHSRPRVVPFCAVVACVTMSAYSKATVNVFCVNIDRVGSLDSAVNILTALWVACLGFGSHRFPPHSSNY